MKFTISSERGPAYTLVPNSFLSTYMPSANGNFVKIYLYLLMLCQNPDALQDRSISGLADEMECTENDILRALRYWKKQGLLMWTGTEDEIRDICLLSTDDFAATAEPAAAIRRSAERTFSTDPAFSKSASGQPAPAPLDRTDSMRAGLGSDSSGSGSLGSGASDSNDSGLAGTNSGDLGAGSSGSGSYDSVRPDAAQGGAETGSAVSMPAASADISEKPAKALPKENPDVHIPAKQNYTALQAEALCNDVEIGRALEEIEQLLGEPLSPAHLQTILYFMCDIGFSADLLITLYKTAIQKGKKQPRYIEAIGISWAKQGIQTPEEAKQESASFSGRYAMVTRTLGITEALAPVNREIIDDWDQYQFTDDMIEEACRRGALQTGGGVQALRYISGILKKWNKNGVRTAEDLKKSDTAFQQKKKEKESKGGAKKQTAPKNQFQNFPQRSYSDKDVDSLEKRLLQNHKQDPK